MKIVIRCGSCGTEIKADMIARTPLDDDLSKTEIVLRGFCTRCEDDMLEVLQSIEAVERWRDSMK